MAVLVGPTVKAPLPEPNSTVPPISRSFTSPVLKTPVTGSKEVVQVAFETGPVVNVPSPLPISVVTVPVNVGTPLFVTLVEYRDHDVGYAVARHVVNCEAGHCA